MHLASVWEAVSDAIPQQLALAHGDVQRTWAQFDDRASRLARGLSQAGVGRGTKVAIAMYNCSEFIEAFYAVVKLSGVPVNVNYRYVADEVLYLFQNADVQAVIFHQSLAGPLLAAAQRIPAITTLVQVDDVDSSAQPAPGVVRYEQLIADNEPEPRRVRSEDDMFLSYTGGTTGLPKGVMNVMGRVTRSMAFDTRGLILGVDGQDDTAPDELALALHSHDRTPVVIPASPLMHSTGFTWTSLPALSAGGSVVTLTSRSFDPHELLSTIERHRVTAIAIVGDAFARPIVRALHERADAGNPYDLSSVQRIISAGVAWSVEMKAAFLDFAPHAALVEGCGATEGATYGLSVVHRGDQLAAGRFDRAPGAVTLDDQRRPTAVGEVGMLAAPTYTNGYYKDDEATKRVYFTFEGTPYVAPGDFGRINADGTITLMGRGSSVVNTGGEKVHPEEVERVMKAMTGVDDCLVFGTPDERHGEVVTALVTLTPGSTVQSAEIVSYVRQRLAAYKAPRRMLFVTDIPRHENGKPDYPSAKRVAIESPQ